MSRGLWQGSKYAEGWCAGRRCKRNASQQAEVCGEMQVGPREAHVEATTTSPNRYAKTEVRKPADCVPVYGRFNTANGEASFETTYG